MWAVLGAAACRAQADQAAGPAPKTIVWRKLGSWTGHGNRQTESFTSESGTLRVRWEASDEGTAGPGAFRLKAHSAISGRLLQDITDQPGAGRGEAFVQQDPHVFYVVIESSHVNWAFTVDEALAYP